jgi:nucleoid-associated protein YgaU
MSDAIALPVAPVANDTTITVVDAPAITDAPAAPKAAKVKKAKPAAKKDEPKAKVEKKVITVTELQLPKDVEMKVCKTAVIFTRGSRKAALKSRSLEITNPVKTFGSRMRIFSEELIEKCHLGAMRALIPSIQDTIDLQKILNKYFATK